MLITPWLYWQLKMSLKVSTTIKKPQKFHQTPRNLPFPDQFHHRTILHAYFMCSILHSDNLHPNSPSLAGNNNKVTKAQTTHLLEECTIVQCLIIMNNFFSAHHLSDLNDLNHSTRHSEFHAQQAETTM